MRGEEALGDKKEGKKEGRRMTSTIFIIISLRSGVDERVCKDGEEMMR